MPHGPSHTIIRAHPMAQGGITRRAVLAAGLTTLFTPIGLARPRAAAQEAATPLPSGPFAATLFDVDGRKLALACKGSGEPTVVFDAGLGNDASAWTAIAPEIATLTRICLWDRPGLGQSSGPIAQTSGAAVATLHSLLQAAAVPPPYLLVGHSYGGLNARLFTASYPGEVVGLVLVDALHEDYLQRLREIEPVQTDSLAEFVNQSPEPADIAASSAQLLAAGPLPDLPAVVVVRGLPAFPPEKPTIATEMLWQELQRDLASRLPRAEVVVAAESGHNIPVDQPQVVITAIEQVLAAVRAEGRA